jgi:two-component system, cell cycle sensor histidine kinase and response regulator CckA
MSFSSIAPSWQGSGAVWPFGFNLSPIVRAPEGRCGDELGERRALRVLLIEDDVDLRALLVAGLSRDGFEVEAVANGRIGLESFVRNRPSIVITDVVMAEADGIEIVRELARIAPDVPVVVVSGHPQYLRHCLAFGATRVLQKPFSLKALSELVAKTVAETA